MSFHFRDGMWLTQEPPCRLMIWTWFHLFIKDDGLRNSTRHVQPHRHCSSLPKNQQCALVMCPIQLYKVSFVLMRFVARNIRAISPRDLNSGQGVLTQFDNGTVGSRPQIVNDSGTAPADMSQLPPEELRKLKGQSLPAPSQPKLVLPESSSVKKTW